MLIHNAHGGGAGTFFLLLLYEGMGVYVIVVALGPNNTRGSRRYMSSSSYLSNNSDGINNIRGF